jgi:hypothetical protein
MINREGEMKSIYMISAVILAVMGASPVLADDIEIRKTCAEIYLNSYEAQERCIVREEKARDLWRTMKATDDVMRYCVDTYYKSYEARLRCVKREAEAQERLKAMTIPDDVWAMCSGSYDTNGGLERCVKREAAAKKRLAGRRAKR